MVKYLHIFKVLFGVLALLAAIYIVMNYIKTITQKGQLLIPKEIRDYLNIELNEQIQIVIENGQVVLKKPVKDLKEFAGIIKDELKLKSDNKPDLFNNDFNVDSDFFSFSNTDNNGEVVNDINDQRSTLDDTNNAQQDSAVVTLKKKKKKIKKIISELDKSMQDDFIDTVNIETVIDSNEVDKVVENMEERIILSKNSKQIDLNYSNSTDLKL